MGNVKGIEELLATAKAGNKQAEDELFSKLRARFLGLVRLKIWNRKKDSIEMQQDVEDVVAEIMAAICNQFRQGLIPPERFMPLANGIANHKIADYFRRKRTTETKFVRLVEMDIPAAAPEQPNGILDRGEVEEITLRALRRLTNRDKEIMRALLENQIGTYIDTQSRTMPRNTIYAHIHRCRRRFEKLLRMEGLEI